MSRHGPGKSSGSGMVSVGSRKKAYVHFVYMKHICFTYTCESGIVIHVPVARLSSSSLYIHTCIYTCTLL